MGQEARKIFPKISEDEIAAYEPEAWRTSLAQKLRLGEKTTPEYHPVRLDISTRTMRMYGSDSALVLSDFEYQILWLLIRARKTTKSAVSSHEISEFIYQHFPEERLEKLANVDNLINAEVAFLRGKMDSFTKEVFIHTERGFGYRLGVLSEGDKQGFVGSKKAHRERKIISTKPRW